MIRSDCHLHSSFSSDSDAALESMVKKGISIGLETMCMTEHLDLNYPENAEGLDFLLDFDAYKCKLYQLKEKYASQIELLFGIELGLLPNLQSDLSEILQKYSFDFAIGSSHLVLTNPPIDPYEPEFFSSYGREKGMQLYFESILENITAMKNLDFQVYGHLDYAIRYAPEKNDHFLYDTYREIIEEILRLLIANDKGIEVNCAGLRVGLGHPNPHTDILKWYRSLGGEILTIGSDAHKPDHIAYGFNQLTEILTNAGFGQYTLFRKQKPYFIDL